MPEASRAAEEVPRGSRPAAWTRSDKLLSRNRIFIDRTQDIGIISKEDAIDYGLTGPNLRGSGVEFDLRKEHPYLGYEHYEFDVPIGTVGRLLRPLPRAHGGDAPERAHPASGARQPARRPDQRASDPKNRAAEEGQGAHEDGGADPPFHRRHRRASTRRRAKSISAPRIRRASSASTSAAKAAACRTG